MLAPVVLSCTWRTVPNGSVGLAHDPAGAAAYQVAMPVSEFALDTGAGGATVVVVVGGGGAVVVVVGAGWGAVVVVVVVGAAVTGTAGAAVVVVTGAGDVVVVVTRPERAYASCHEGAFAICDDALVIASA